jgi:L-ascorbate metabolism protein UlaG (beta-lactamase superfamily)
MRQIDADKFETCPTKQGGTMVANIFWLGHDSFRLTGEKIVYIDPWKLADDSVKADVVLVTHEHGDHCSPDDVRKISRADTVVVAPASAANKLGSHTMIVQPGDKIHVAGIAIQAKPAYNPNKKFHPQSAGHVGYIVTLNGKHIYHTGDTDEIPEMAGMQVDIALLPVSGTYVMTATEAAHAASTIKPDLAIPMHYGDADVVGTKADAEEFKRLAGVPVEILEKSK